jgi:hypothetical protein
MFSNLNYLLRLLKEIAPDTHKAFLDALPTPELDTFNFPIAPHPFLDRLSAIDSMRTKVQKSGVNIFGVSASEQYEVYRITCAIEDYIPGASGTIGPEDWLRLHRAVEKFDLSLAETREKDLRTTFETYGRHFVSLLAGTYYNLAKDKHKGGDSWGEHNLTKDTVSLRSALIILQIETILEGIDIHLRNIVSQLGTNDSSVLFGLIYLMAGNPETFDFRWGEHHAFDDRSRLIRALHCIGALGGPVMTSECYGDWESDVAERSFFYDVPGKSPLRGQIGFVNGMNLTPRAAFYDAYRLWQSACQGNRLTCVYSATKGGWDYLGGLYAQKGIVLPASRLLIHQWAEFLTREPHARFLQICASRGAIEVQAALLCLPEEIRKRIIVIAIAPAYLIPSTACYRAVNLVIEEDPVPILSPNHDLIGISEDIWILLSHDDGANPHDLHGLSYRKVLAQLVDRYLFTNDIV